MNYDYFENVATIVGAVLAVLTIVIIFICVVVKNKHIKTLPERTIKSTVVAKNIVVETENVFDGNNYNGRETTCYNLAFRTEHHAHWTFNVSFELFNAVIEGDKGILTYKESKRQKVFFVSFHRQT